MKIRLKSRKSLKRKFLRKAIRNISIVKLELEQIQFSQASQEQKNFNKNVKATYRHIKQQLGMLLVPFPTLSFLSLWVSLRQKTQLSRNNRLRKIKTLKLKNKSKKKSKLKS